MGNGSVYEHLEQKLIDDASEVQRRTQGAIEEHGGVFLFAPNFTARAFCKPGMRLKLDPNDYYALDGARGTDERWFASTTKADNADLTLDHEGLSAIVLGDGQVVRFVDSIEALGAAIIGEELVKKYDGKWPMYSKFFDNAGALPHHIHHDDKSAALVGQKGKPEAYFFPAQQNNHGALFPYTFFGINPGTEPDQILKALMNFHKGDNKITALSSAQRLVVDTGWDVPPGVLHAPGSLCTYEPQKASDVFAMYESVTQDRQRVPWELLWKDTPDDLWRGKDPSEMTPKDYQVLVDRINWALNTDPKFVENRYMVPVPVGSIDKMAEQGYLEEWICYRSDDFDAKRLTVFPGQEVEITDAGAYGFITIEGQGIIKGQGGKPLDIESPTLIKYGQLTRDEGFVTHDAARKGVTIRNASNSEPLVMLKHRGPEYEDLNRNAVIAQNLEIQRAG